MYLVESLTVSGLVGMMLSMGFKSNPGDVLASVRDFRGTVAGLVANFVLVPAATMGLLYAFDGRRRRLGRRGGDARAVRQARPPAGRGAGRRARVLR
jgi:hypothetical protein